MAEHLPLSDLPVPAPAGNGVEHAGPLGRFQRGGGGEFAAPAEGPDPTHYLGILHRARWLIIVTSVSGLAAGAVVARYTKPVYEAQATIWVESPQPDRGNADQGPIRSGQLLAASGGWMDLLKSYLVLDHAVAAARLYLSRPPDVDPTLFEEFSLRERFRPGMYRLSVDPGGTLVTLAADGGAVVERAAPEIRSAGLSASTGRPPEQPSRPGWRWISASPRRETPRWRWRPNWPSG